MKKIICLILALTIIMSSFGVFAGEYLPLYENMDSVFRFDVGEFIEGDAEGEVVITPAMRRMQLLENLGIWDDADKGENELVTLTEFSVIMSRLKLGAGNALEGVYEVNESTGNATYRNAYAYLLEALGYAYRCKEYQNSDEGLLIVSSQIGLLSERPENIGAYITRGALAELIAKALTIDMCVMEYTSGGGHKFTVAEGRNLLNSVHGIYEIQGFVNAIPGLSVYGGSSLREGYIQIDRRNIKTNGLDLDKFYGTRVISYATFDKDTNTYSVIYMDYAEDYQALEIDFNDIVEIKNGMITYVNDENVELDVDVDNLSYISENGKTLASIYEMSDYKANEGKIVLTASERKGDIDTAIIYKYNYFVAAYTDVNQYRIGLNFRQQYNGSESIQLNDKAVIKITVDGAVTTLDKLPAAAFRMFRCEETGYTEIVAVTTKVTGAVEAMYENTVQIGEEEYTLTRDLLNHIEYCKNQPGMSDTQKVKELQLGSVTTFYVFEDKIVCYSSTQEYKYGYLKSVSEARTSIDPDLIFRILTQDGEWADFKANKPIEFDGEPRVSKERVIEKIKNNIDIINNVVRFKANGKGELLALDTIEESQYEANTTEDIKFTANHSFIRNWTGDWLSLGASYCFSANTVFFVAPSGETNEDKFRVVRASQLPGAREGNEMPMKFYNIDDYNRVLLAVCTRSFEEFDGGGETGAFYYIEGIRRTIVSKEDQIYGYKLMAKKISCTDSMVMTERKGLLIDESIAVSEDMLDKNNVGPDDPTYKYDNLIEVGDIIQATVTGGEITNWSMLLKGGEVGQLSQPNDDINDYRDTTTYEVFAKGKITAINPADAIVVIESEGVKHPAFTACHVVVDTLNDEIELVSAADFHEGDIIYTYIRYGRMTFMVKNK